MEALVAGLREALQPDMLTRAKALASRIEPRGARNTAERLIREFG
jgi:adenosylmethionine-8-amino-7-oxononanoate aminotransferase